MNRGLKMGIWFLRIYMRYYLVIILGEGMRTWNGCRRVLPVRFCCRYKTEGGPGRGKFVAVF